MRTSRLGRSAVEVTELGLGGGPLGNLFTAVDDDAAAATLAAAWDCGIRFFDTSPHYGLGLSERRTGNFLHGKPRAEFTLSTKAGRLLVPQDPAGGTDERFAVPATHRRVWDFSRDGVRRSLQESLDRMGTDRVDVLLLHDAEEHFETALRHGWPALAELRAQGVVGAVGAGMHDTALLARLVREADLDVVMLSGRCTLLERSALDELLPACAERGVSVLAASVFNSGLLASARPAAGAMFDYAPAPPELLRRAHRIADVCAAHAVTLPQAAMAFPLLHPAVVGVVVGMRSAAEVRSDVEAFETGVPGGLWTDLREAGLLGEQLSG
ncbi:aldo/keto reductase [Streptomyces meridianus]|uniref:Aldo/keto reductase n=1 Tax=Streptomyces meridianus TaxID=2938945 RepID=A0ABT0XB99_9ACTN|nr:aldo/keto reductase [Streptomyces meridianus]MCM2579079.1 aldo/keto reductase [Streptomyces meridianus]